MSVEDVNRRRHRRFTSFCTLIQATCDRKGSLSQACSIERGEDPIHVGSLGPTSSILCRGASWTSKISTAVCRHASLFAVKAGRDAPHARGSTCPRSSDATPGAADGREATYPALLPCEARWAWVEEKAPTCARSTRDRRS